MCTEMSAHMTANQPSATDFFLKAKPASEAHKNKCVCEKKPHTEKNDSKVDSTNDSKPH